MKNKIWTFALALAIAFGFWLYVISYVSPGSDETITGIPVFFEGETILEERGLMITSDSNATVTLKISGNRSDLIKLNRDNITLKVDLTKVYDAGVKELRYSITYPGDVPNGAVTVESQYPEAVSITVEKKVSKPVDIGVVFTGEVDEGFIADTENWVLDFPTVNVKGPSSVVDQIHHARIDVSLDDRRESISENYRYILCDAEDQPVDVELVTTDVAEVHLDVKIQRFKEVPLTVNVKYGGGASESNTKVIINPETIYVAGSEALLQDLEQIVLGTGTIDLSVTEEDLEQTFPITLPEGVTNLSGVTEAQVQIKFVGLAIKEFDVSEIKAINLPEGMDYDLMNQVLKVRLRGPAAVMESIQPENIQVTIDFAGKEMGSFTMKPVITVEGEAYASVGAVGTYGVSVTLREKDEP